MGPTGIVAADDLQKFMFDHSIKGCSSEICNEIITEFDSDFNGSLSYDEFVNIFLPAANETLRDHCLRDRVVRYRKS